MSTPFPIPTGLRPKAQGCEARATLGEVPKHFPQPHCGCGTTARDGHNLVEVGTSLRRFPKVARPSQPWAGGHSPFGADGSRTLGTLRDVLLPNLLSDELRLPSPRLRQAGVPSAGKSVKLTA
jgi:hypothetical protein